MITVCVIISKKYNKLLVIICFINQEVVCFSDLKKGFDKVNHSILMKKLLLLGVTNYCVYLLYYMYDKQNVISQINYYYIS